MGIMGLVCTEETKNVKLEVCEFYAQITMFYV